MNKHAQNLLHAKTQYSALYRKLLGSKSHAKLIAHYAACGEARVLHEWERRLDHSVVRQPSGLATLRTVRPWRKHKS